MTQVPMQVLSRPFAIEPVTNVMLPDGIFDNALYQLKIACHYTNMSNTNLENVTLYLESVGDPGITLVPQTFTFATIPKGATVLLSWTADFRNAAPGKRLVSFVAKSDGFDSRRSIQQIFVSETRFDSALNRYTCKVEEGTLTVSDISAIGPARTKLGRPSGLSCECDPDFGPYIPTGMTMDWTPNPAYAGIHGDLPFSDPWWKILAIIVAALAAIVAVVAAALGLGNVSFGVKGQYKSDPFSGVNCCKPELPQKDPLKPKLTVAGVASMIATGAIYAACSDAADPFWRGQDATPPADGEITVGEKVIAAWQLPEAPNAGKAYSVDVKWEYTRLTSGQSYHYAVAETQVNVHVCDSVEVITPDKVKAFETIWCSAKFSKSEGNLFRGAELYAFSLFRAPGGLHFVIPLTDDGIGLDAEPNDGVYTGSLDLKSAYRTLLQSHEEVYGIWRVFVFAQDVNLTKPGTPPQIAAQHIGGVFVATAIEITFDPSLPCPLKAQGTIMVI